MIGGKQGVEGREEKRKIKWKERSSKVILRYKLKEEKTMNI